MRAVSCNIDNNILPFSLSAKGDSLCFIIIQAPLCFAVHGKIDIVKHIAVVLFA